MDHSSLAQPPPLETPATRNTIRSLAKSLPLAKINKTSQQQAEPISSTMEANPKKREGIWQGEEV